MNIAIFFMGRALHANGRLTYTTHLMESLRMAGNTVALFKVRAREENTLRPLFRDNKSFMYQNIDPTAALKIVEHTPSIITAPAYLGDEPEVSTTWKMLRAGARLVLHDPKESEVHGYFDNKKLIHRPFCVRHSMKAYYRDAVHIPHPYVRRNTSHSGNRRRHAVSIARVAADKRTNLILSANESLPKQLRVDVRGAVFRLYGRGLEKKFPSYKMQSPFPRVWGAGAAVCRDYKFMVDMTNYQGDGGGSQYTFMEAWDAGTIPVIHTGWLLPGGEMRDQYAFQPNCVSVTDDIDLAAFLRKARYDDMNMTILEGFKTLSKHHSPDKVAEAYVEELSRG